MPVAIIPMMRNVIAVTVAIIPMMRNVIAVTEHSHETDEYLLAVFPC